MNGYFRNNMVDEQIGKVAMMQSSAQAQARRKGIGVKAWLVLSEIGQSHLEEVEKQSIMRRTGLPARDLRALDPMLSYPSSIFGRERAIVINLEHIKAIITATEILMINSSNPLFVQFVEDLRSRINFSMGAPIQEMTINDLDGDEEPLLGSSKSFSQSKRFSQSFNAMSDMSTSLTRDHSLKNTENATEAAVPKQPFEFKALEVCLESACKCLESETKTLEEEAYPALDELTSKISTLNLERVRQIKSRLVAISGRVHKVRDELEHLLDDDNDMAEMYLTQKLVGRSMDHASILKEEAFEEDHERDEESNSENLSLIDLKPNVEELEMLIEAYFAQIDGIMQKLSDMSEYVDDTEDFINIMLDDKQNQLLQMAVMLNTATLIINAGIVVVGVFGMNIHITLYDSTSANFIGTVLGTLGGCVALYLMAVGWGKNRFLLPS